MDIKGINELLERYRNNQCTNEERKLVEDWFDAQSAAGKWEWSKEEEQITGAQLKNRIDRKLFARSNSWNTFFRVAAVITVLLGSLLFFKNDIRNIVNPVVYLEKQVADGKQLMITLSDGSKVWLNSNSKFKYPKDFNRDTREVILLEGEAYFDIVHDESKPFIVTSKNVRTQVLGTAFNIKSYNYLSDIEVAVTRGKVRVNEMDPSTHQNPNSVILLPDESVSVTRAGKMEKQKVDASQVIAWQKGNLTFNNDRLADVCAVLTHKYKVKIEFENDNLKDYRLTAGFSNTDKLDDILLVLSSANNLSYSVKGSTILFRQK